MNQMTEMMQTSNERMKQIMRVIRDGRPFNAEAFSVAQREYEAQIKQVNLVIQAYAVSSKNKRAMAGMEKMNMLDENTAIDLGFVDISSEKVKCRGCNEVITRDKCLDTSGSNNKYDECDGCEVGKDTKSRMIQDGY